MMMISDYDRSRGAPNSDIEIIGNDLPATSNSSGDKGRRKSIQFNIPETGARDDQAFFDFTFDFREGSVAYPSVNRAGGADVEDPEHTLLAKGLEKSDSHSVGSTVIHNASSRIKQVSQRFKRLASGTTVRPQPGPGGFDQTNSGAAHALQSLRFISTKDDKTSWAAVYERFNSITSSTKWLLPRSRFGECIGLNKDSNDFAVKLFDALRRKQGIPDDSINVAQLKGFWDHIVDENFDSRLAIFFDMVDKDGDGRITEEEVREIFVLCASANKLSNIQKQADEYAAMLMEGLDPDKCGYVMIENLKMLLMSQVPSHNVRGYDKKFSQILSKKLQGSKRNPIRSFFRDLAYFFPDNWKRIWVIALWFGAMAGLFAWKFIQYRNRAAYDVMGHCVSMAKGGAETLKLNMALILMPVCRNTITWVRNKTKLGAVVPFEDNLNFHQMIAVAIAIGVGIHGIYHLVCDFPRLLYASPKKYEPMIQYFGEQPTSYWHFVMSFEGISGIIMVVLMAIAFTLATPWFRRGKISLPKPFNKLTGFNAFWYAHHSFIIVYGLLIAHGIKLYLTHEWYKKTTWMYLVIPMTIYACERLIRAFRSSIKDVNILKVAIYPNPNGLLALHMSKPAGYKYKSGQYMFVNCPAVSPFEWHPFSITSAPGDDHLSVYIRTCGDWTGQLATVFSEVCQPTPDHKKSGLLMADFLPGEDNPKLAKVRIDGPYGSPSQDYKNYEVVMLIGQGVGATPMISIVKDILNNMKAREAEEKSLENGTGSRASSSSNQFKTRRAYFYWATREPGSFDWFKGIMDEVVEMDKDEVIEIHSYCSSVYEEGDARSALISMVQYLNHEKNGIDVVSGTRVKCHFGRPVWYKAYKHVAVSHPNQRVGVFYCGMPQLVKELRREALKFSHQTWTKFDFYNETC